jgi:glycosyltransferase involved in cell wall biosynthesis
VRFVAYDDQVYERDPEGLWTDRTFPLFIAEVGADLGSLVLVGRLREGRTRASFQLPPWVEFVGLPFYASLASPLKVVSGALAALRVFWRQLDDVDGAWILGPHPLGLVFALMTFVRRRRLVLGVRQEMKAYARRRHPSRRLVHLAADLLEASWRLLARFCAVVVVGPELAGQYRRARRLHVLHVSMMRTSHMLSPEAERSRRYDGELTILSVGRLDEEKNPLLLADVLAAARASGRLWRLIVCGVGSLEDELARQLEGLGVADAAELRGYVPIDAGLRDVYREAHVFLHVSWTEGVPQVLFEAFAARLPVVATDVGGVSAVAEGASLMIPPGDRDAAVAALERLASDPGLRERLTDAGAAQAAQHTLESEAARVAAFLTA